MEGLQPGLMKRRAGHFRPPDWARYVPEVAPIFIWNGDRRALAIIPTTIRSLIDANGDRRQSVPKDETHSGERAPLLYRSRKRSHSQAKLDSREKDRPPPFLHASRANSIALANSISNLGGNASHIDDDIGTDDDDAAAFYARQVTDFQDKYEQSRKKFLTLSQRNAELEAEMEQLRLVEEKNQELEAEVEKLTEQGRQAQKVPELEGRIGRRDVEIARLNHVVHEEQDKRRLIEGELNALKTNVAMQLKGVLSLVGGGI